MKNKCLLFDKLNAWLIVDWYRLTRWIKNVYALTTLTLGGLWTGMEDHTTWTLLYIDYLTCTNQVDRTSRMSFTCSAQLYWSCHVSSSCLTRLDRLGHVSSTFNISSSLRLLSKQHCGPSLEVNSQRATRPTQTGDVSCVPLISRSLYRWVVQRNMMSSTRLVHMSLKELMSMNIQKRGPSSQDSETYKWRYLKSSRGIKFIYLE
jgi:hypothetical protein